MRIHLAFDQSMEKFVKDIRENLTEKGFTVSINDDIIHFEGREINVGAFSQLRSRNPNNPHIRKIKKAIIELERDKLLKSDSLLIFNPLGTKSGYINGQMYLNMIIAWMSNIPIYVLEKPDDSLAFKEEILALEPIILDGNLDKIVRFEKGKIEEAIESASSRLLESANKKINDRPKLKRMSEE